MSTTASMTSQDLRLRGRGKALAFKIAVIESLSSLGVRADVLTRRETATLPESLDGRGSLIRLGGGTDAVAMTRVDARFSIGSALTDANLAAGWTGHDHGVAIIGRSGVPAPGATVVMSLPTLALLLTRPQTDAHANRDTGRGIRDWTFA